MCYFNSNFSSTTSSTQSKQTCGRLTVSSTTLLRDMIIIIMIRKRMRVLYAQCVMCVCEVVAMTRRCWVAVPCSHRSIRNGLTKITLWHLVSCVTRSLSLPLLVLFFFVVFFFCGWSDSTSHPARSFSTSPPFSLRRQASWTRHRNVTRRNVRINTVGLEWAVTGIPS